LRLLLRYFRRAIGNDEQQRNISPKTKALEGKKKEGGCKGLERDGELYQVGSLDADAKN
jgi:hypothetical protein